MTLIKKLSKCPFNKGVDQLPGYEFFGSGSTKPSKYFEHSLTAIRRIRYLRDINKFG